MKNTTPGKSTTSSRPAGSMKVTKKINATLGINANKTITADLRNAMITEAAYYISEKCGFNPSLTDQCWFEAEKQIDAKILD